MISTSYVQIVLGGMIKPTQDSDSISRINTHTSNRNPRVRPFFPRGRINQARRTSTHSPFAFSSPGGAKREEHQRTSTSLYNTVQSAPTPTPIESPIDHYQLKLIWTDIHWCRLRLCSSCNCWDGSTERTPLDSLRHSCSINPAPECFATVTRTNTYLPQSTGSPILSLPACPSVTTIQLDSPLQPPPTPSTRNPEPGNSELGNSDNGQDIPHLLERTTGLRV